MFILSYSISFVCFSFSASSLFGIQEQHIHSPVKSSTLPLRKMPVFQGVSPWHTIFISPWVIPLWDSATAHLPSAQELNSYSQGDARFSGFAPWHSISLHPSSSLFETQQELTHTLVKDSSLPL